MPSFGGGLVNQQTAMYFECLLQLGEEGAVTELHSRSATCMQEAHKGDKPLGLFECLGGSGCF